MNLVAEVLDQQISDRYDKHMGKVDGIIAELRPGRPPRLVAIECGLAVAARRVGRRFERVVLAFGRWFGVRKEPRFRIAWTQVTDVGLDVNVDVDAESTPETDWEHWLRNKVFRWIPF